MSGEIIRKSLLFTFLATILSVFSIFAEEIKIGAGAAANENILKPIKNDFEKKFNIILNVLPWGPVKAMQDLDNGLIDIAAIGVTWEEMIEMLNKENVKLSDKNAFNVTQIGEDNIKVIVNKVNPVSKLSKDELKQIFTGKITNWKDLDGRDEIISIIWGKLIPGTNNVFKKVILDNEEIYKDAIIDATTAEDVVEKVKSNTESIGIIPSGAVTPDIKVLDTPKVSRPINFVTKGTPSDKVKKLIDYIRGEGQSLIKK